MLQDSSCLDFCLHASEAGVFWQASAVGLQRHQVMYALIAQLGLPAFGSGLVDAFNYLELFSDAFVNCMQGR